MSAADVVEVLDVLEAADVAVFLDGGWGVDALIGAQTREHDDLDVHLSLEDPRVRRRYSWPPALRVWMADGRRTTFFET
ncbi:MAG: hypothetical protein WKF65_09165 [Gaiellaceae bacterium]